MIQIRNLKKIFGEHEVLQGIDLHVKHGETVVIIGPSGSGKSTLLRCINLLEEPSDGEIWIDGVIIDPKNAMLIRKKVSMVFQQFNLFNNMTVLENIMYAPVKALKEDKDTVRKRAMKLLEQVGLKEKADKYPSSLSGGQKQRVAIVRSLAMEPEVLLFDEPTSALDPEMVKEVLNVIKNLAHTGITILMNTHEMGFAREVADRILFLDGGKIIEDRDPKGLFESPKSERVRDFLEKVL